jgi:tetratricopeptide (TPR) repeat protein
VTVSTRLLDANERQLADTTDSAQRTRLLQDRAILQARLGRTDEALRTLDLARQAAPQDLPATLALRFEYASAIARYFGKHFAEAREQMSSVLERALELADSVLCTECESTLALFMQREGDVRGAARYARSVLGNAGSSLESRYRATLALASLHHDARDYEEAVRLYHETKDVVRALGDEIAMASWMGRSALSQAAHARQAAASGELDARTLKDATEALESSIAYSEQLQEAPDMALTRLLLAEMRVLQKRYREALALYDAQLPIVEGDGFLHEVTAAMADRAQCLLKLGDADGAYSQAAAALKRLDQSTPADIRAIVHENMASALHQAGHAIEAEQHRLLSRMAWETYAHEQREARRLLRENPVETLH